ncbi:thioredoxin-disulfide reductase [Actinomyces minihominis]|uniref:thioredoxin-disulfide reductase n=1 Tax=Actinomyces minihominis TaxID=2002838 RepID=UPI000C07F1F6|nr:thioredoxin-disulfide reductase [Actinomyces minihominis]
MSKTVEDLVVLGSGPAGYTAAIYAARAGLNPLVVAGAIDAGGALMTTTDVENFPGFPEGVQGPDLMAKMQAQAEKFGARVEFDDASAVDFSGETFKITLYDRVVEAKSVIISTGSAYRHMNVPGEDLLSGRGVSYCATCDGFFFKGKELAVVGGGDSAMEEALFLTRFAAKVTIVHRRDELRASKVMADRAMANDKIEFAWDSVVTEVLGKDGVEGLALKNTKTGEVSELPVQGVFVAIGHDPRSDLFKGQLDLTPGGYIVVDEPGTLTSRPGIFAAGDVVDDTYRQAITAAGTGCRAALDAQRYLEGLE